MEMAVAGKNDVSQEEKDLFRKAVQGANRDHRNYRQERHIPDTPARKAPVKIKETALNESGVMIDATGYGDYVEFARGGLQKNIMRKMKRGDFRVTATLDLHGDTAAQAESRLNRFVQHALASGKTTVSIIHGKGLRSGASGGVLKPVTLNWLKQQPAVQAFCSALPRDGGTGAVYVLLRTTRRGGRLG